ncbi:hypothetical protein F8O06_05045 [Pseudoclavibacter sp. CFCC 14310]|uniref:hypothetical protein n=1 Tax=Pseudoclavibacter sp. CFCC 14310 TaxID=2615180 RepID=UPI001300DD8E|nr:hypothetical protein [Pseudoclavibacter sp. CFCC 14310]KAB1645409.1 hypothetical protein F8O06_07400 [Pseudoclavibacter sp. CFCC 14310]KAB1646132.1 hypothetical protein F8O06_05045 [Pseudoclavibacter sp. CFCC 14310]
MCEPTEADALADEQSWRTEMLDVLGVEDSDDVSDHELILQQARKLVSEHDRLTTVVESVRATLTQDEPGNPYMYNPWEDESVDPTNLDDVVQAAVSRGIDFGAWNQAERVRGLFSEARVDTANGFDIATTSKVAPSDPAK